MQINLKAIGFTPTPQVLAVGAPILCALLIASVSVPLAMWTPIVDPTVVLAGRPATEQAKPNGFAARVTAARVYLVQTAQPGYTMTRQGPALAIERLHPDFALRLANAVREARAQGLEKVGIFSAYRPPAFGIGGFHNKFQSLHAYGLAVDVSGIGQPGSAEARLWHGIAAKNDLTCPYGRNSRKEWNHCQITETRIILASNPLSKTITGEGPVQLDQMWGSAKPMLIKANDPPDPLMTRLRSELARLDAAEAAGAVARGKSKHRFAKLAKWRKGHGNARLAGGTTKQVRKG